MDIFTDNTNKALDIECIRGLSVGLRARPERTVNFFGKRSILE